MVLDLKESVYNNENNIIKIVTHYSFPILLSSFNPNILFNCLKINADLLIGILFDELPYDWKNIIKNLNVYSIHLNYEHLNDMIIDEIIKEGYPLITFTVNDTKICNDLFSKGITSIITDEIFDD